MKNNKDNFRPAQETISIRWLANGLVIKLRSSVKWTLEAVNSFAGAEFRFFIRLFLDPLPFVASAPPASLDPASRPVSRPRALMGLSHCVAAVGAAGSSLRGLLRLRLAGRPYWELWEPQKLRAAATHANVQR